MKILSNSAKAAYSAGLTAAVIAGGMAAMATSASADSVNEVVELKTGVEVDTENVIDLDPFQKGDTPRIVGGTAARQGEFPWIVKLLIKTPKGTYGCGGTIVSSNIVISAQHCVDKDVEAVTMYYGDVVWKQGTKVEGERLVKGRGVKKGDWAVIKTSTAMRPSEFAKVATGDALNSGPMFTAAGWGTTSSGGSSPRALLKVDLPFIDDDKCGYGRNEICAGDWERGGIDTCQGDSGGPLVNYRGGGATLVGITSWGSGCADRRSPGHYTEVSTFESQMADAVRKMGGQMYNGGGTGPTTPIDTPTTDPTTPGGGGGGGNAFFNNSRQPIEDYRTARSEVNSTYRGANKVKVEIDINHSCLQNLELAITTPDGVRNVVKRSSYAWRCTAWRGTKSETYPLRSKSDGSWVLEAGDNRRGNTGTLNGWGITLS